MKIYLLYEEHYDTLYSTYDQVNVYPYKTLDGIIQRLMDECGMSKEDVKRDLKETNSLSSGDFYYRVEITDLNE